MFEMLTWTEFCWLSDWNLSKTNKKVNVVHVYEWMDKQQWHEWWYCNQINKSNQIKLYLYGTFKKVFQTALQRFINNNRQRETANKIKRRWLGSETWGVEKATFGGQPHWERSRSKAAGSAATETTPTNPADRRPRTKVQSSLATPVTRPETTPSLAGPYEETLEFKNW